MLDAQLLEILICPVSGGKLVYRKDKSELWCKASALAYPVRDDVPIMRESEARKLDEREREREEESKT